MWVLWTILLLVAFSGCLRHPVPSRSDERGFWSEKPAGTWEEALLTGNGTQGALVMGIPINDTIIFSHALLYMPLHQPLPPVGTGVKLDTIRKMMFDGRYAEASQYVVDLSHGEGWGGKRWTDPFVPAFDLIINMTGDTMVSDYRRSVDFTTGEAVVSWTGQKGRYRRSVFASRADNLIAISIRGPGKGLLNCRVSLADRPRDNSWWQGLYNSTSRSTTISSGPDGLRYRCDFDKQWPGSIRGVEGLVQVINYGGSAEPSGNEMIIHGSNEVLLICRYNPAFNPAFSQMTPLASSSDYHSLLTPHKKIHGEMFKRVSLDLGGDPDRNLSTEELLERSAATPLPALLEKEFDAARYNILCATGIMPPNLQGIWAGTTAPPWSGDFTQNGNLQVAISVLLPGNLPELMEGFFSYQEGFLPAYRENARLLYNCRGIHVASRTSSHGLNNHFDRTWPMTFWTAGAAWMSQFFYDYYLYTGDFEFLKNRAVPFMKEAAQFYEDFLIPADDGKWIFNPSYSPENNPGNSPDQACINATMDVMAARQLYRNLIDAGLRLGLSADTIAAWRGMLSGMPEYQINRDGALKEYLWNSLADNYAHRHASHLYGLWDVTDPDIVADPRLTDACRRAVDERMKVRRQEDGGVMAFGMVQLALAAAALGDSVAVEEMINWLGRGYWFSNLVSTHNPRELFNLDLSGGFPALIIKSLVYAEPGLITLLPACPPAWDKGSLEGTLLRGQITLDELTWDEDQVKLILVSQINQRVRIKLGPEGQPREITLRKGRPERIILKKENRCVNFTLLKPLMNLP